jgi:hypothetical protein
MAAADVYCNTSTDLQAVVPDIGSYDTRVRVQGFGSPSGIVYVARNAGPVARLYRDGIDLGAAQASAAACNTDGEWHFDATTDTLTLASTLDPDTRHAIEAGPDEQDAREAAVEFASDLVRSLANRPILKLGSGKSATGSPWPAIIVRCAAYLACAELVRPTNRDLAGKLEARCIGGEDQRPGWLDMIRDGRIALPSETSSAAQAGIVTEVTKGTGSTGAITQLRGRAAVDSDVLLVEITTGGTLVAGTASPVRYKVLGKDETGLQRGELLAGETATGGYTPLGYGLSGRFAPGVYVAGDTWEIEVAGDAATAGAQAYQVEC